MSRSEVPEIRTLTGLRSYAALWVALFHLPFTIGVRPHVQLGDLATHGAWGVDVFFVLSGFILSLLYAPRFQAAGFGRNYRDYLAARFARIYPLHAFTLLILAAWVLGQLLAGEAVKGNFGARALAMNLTLTHGWGLASGLSWNYPSWSISAEWFAYLLLAPALALCLSRCSAIICMLIAGSAWTLLVAASHAMELPVHAMTFTWAVPRIVAEFTLGYALYRVHDSTSLPAGLSDALLVAGLAVLAGLCFAPPAAEALLAPAIAAVVLGLSRAGRIGRALFANRLATFWGERSYAIYMLHAVVMYFAGQAVVRLGLSQTSEAQAWLMFAGVALLVLLASHLAYGWVERPMRRRLRARLEARPVPPATRAVSEAAPAPASAGTSSARSWR